MRLVFLALLMTFINSLQAQILVQKKNVSDVGIINENLIWIYKTPRYDSSKVRTFSKFAFNGTSIINSKEYHNLYCKTSAKTDGIIDEYGNIINDDLLNRPFDFTDLTPIAYIRQEGKKYYMLLPDLSSYPWIGNCYGSDKYETLIYDFSAKPGETYPFCEGVDWSCSINNRDYFQPLVWLPTHDGLIKVDKYESVTTNEGISTICQFTSGFIASESFGAIIPGTLAFPGWTTMAESTRNDELVRVIDSNGKIVFTAPFTGYNRQ